MWLAYQNYRLVVGGGKEAVVYLLNADSLGDKDHQTPSYVSPRLDNVSGVLEEKGIWGAPALWKDEAGQSWIYIPMWGETSKQLANVSTTNGPTPHGSIVAFNFEMDRFTKARSLKTRLDIAISIFPMLLPSRMEWSSWWLPAKIRDRIRFWARRISRVKKSGSRTYSQPRNVGKGLGRHP
jgi:hypothetical protein